MAAWAIYHRLKQSSKQKLPLPPGPKPLPLVGNLFDYPHDSPWLTYRDWCKEYGEIVSISILGQQTIILDSVDAITDLMGKRSAIYSDRTSFPMLNDLIGWHWNFAFMKYGSEWRRRRRVFNEHFNQSTIRSLYPIHAKHSRLLMQRLLQSPEDFESHLRHNLTASIMEGVFAMDIKDQTDPFIEIAETALLSLSIAGIPGTYYVDNFPFLKYLPSWFPGAGFKKQAREWGKYVRSLRVDAFTKLKERMAADEARPCIAKSLLDNADPDDEKLIEAIRDATAIAFGAGADTSVASNLIFLLALVLYPEAQQKAQDEIDAVVGRDRLPDFRDQPNLPYVNALCKEVMRWQNVTPLAVAHAATEDDVYKGYFIPGGSVVIANAWAVMHDPEVYPEPEIFKPERFLKDGKLDRSVRDPLAYAFGFGRRICPGRYFALDSLYSVATAILACFTVEPPLGENGERQMPLPQMTTGVICMPEAFDAIIKPRYEGVKSLIENSIIDIQEV
ncbi:putative CyP450 monooxygenase [Macrolepiota fuliginosa MF-IS2]|uniref:CyP450 monooxygenase n=1 Tax=Macrolepiota fuliginosa MF-IS2 TaxID=1400762 RepID=A0A9P5XD05_9AGAR|nr:putative CyP450 monooxygenase [Macrolepiota fuliginosa MF-IS2]